MFRTGLSSLTAFAMLLHAALGCCWHAHGGDDCGSHAAGCEGPHLHWPGAHGERHHAHGGTHAKSARPCAHHHHGPSDVCGDDAPEPAAPAPCDHPTCVYLQTETSLAVWQQHLAADFASCLNASADCPSATPLLATTDGANGHRFRSHRPAVDAARHRAQLQVWLV